MAQKFGSTLRNQLNRSILLLMTFLGACVMTSLSEIVAMTPRWFYSNSALAETKSAGEQLYNEASQAIVSIETSDRKGSGAIIQSNGLVVTNAHVVAGNQIVNVILADGTPLEADVVATGEQCQDVALIQIRKRNNFPIVKLGSRTPVRIGQEVFTIGNSGPYSRSFKTGIVSRFQPGDRHIQTTLPLDPGDSGSPLLQSDGIMIGLNTLIDPDTRSLSFSIPVESIQELLRKYEAGQTAYASKHPANPQFISLSLNGLELSGKLTQNSEVICENKSYFNRYQFKGEAGQSIMLRLESKAFPPSIVLMDSSERVIAIDKNSGGDDYALIIQQLPSTETYTVIANSRIGDRQGNYTLSAVPLKLWRHGLLAPGNPKYKDGKWYQEFYIQATANQDFVVIAYSPEFAPQLKVVGSDGKLISETNNATPNGQGAVLKIRPPRAGVYKIQISTSKLKEQGTFSLIVQ